MQLQQIRSRIRRFCSFIDNPNMKDPNEVESRIKSAETSFREYNETVDKLAMLGESEDNAMFENTYFKAISKAKTLLEEARQPKPVDSGSSSKNSSVCITDNMNLKTITLEFVPGISVTPTLPTFHGRYTEWLLFQETFSWMVDKNPQLNDIEKFLYLKSCLKGQTAELMTYLSPSQDNYALVWKQLRDRYQNKKLLVKSHLKSMFELNVVKKESCKALRNLLNNYYKNVRALDSLGQPTASWDVLLEYILSSKLDSATRIEYLESVASTTEMPKVADLTQFIEKKCQVLQSLEGTHGKHTSTNST